MTGEPAKAKRNLVFMIGLAGLGVLAALVFSNVYLLKRTGEIANKVQYDQEKKLARLEIDNQILLFAHDQAQISGWDEAYIALTGDLDEGFVEREIAGWLWPDFDIPFTIVVSSENTPIVAVYKDEVVGGEKVDIAIAESLDLIKEARARYFGDIPAPTESISEIDRDKYRSGKKSSRFAWSIREFKGKLLYVMAEALTPPEDVTIAQGSSPPVLLTFKVVNEAFLKAVGDKLLVEDFQMTLDDKIDHSYGSLPIGLSPDKRIVHARWTPHEPSLAIWSETLPTLAVPFLIAALTLLAIVWRFSKMLVSLQKSEEQNRFLALHDALTDLPNRLFFDRELERVIAAKKQDRCAILCMDLDRFKMVNDKFGHQAGDAVLITISCRIRERVGKSGIVARIGGDEFSIMLFERLEEKQVIALCQDLIADVCLPINVPGGVAEVGASIGVAWWPDDALTVKSIIRCADKALYVAKDSGRCQVSCASKLKERENPDGSVDYATTQDLRDLVARASSGSASYSDDAQNGRVLAPLKRLERK
ncbi:diguanylate cyclase domain-containing protein [uncultured Cohaesibacter sp.]|uniref:sensor domain-containing diguanylate cyclase n=1 Tax=uncultured Cohaesibacter sp. TaxID=1002546 RepID=UPI002930E163|nr:diguanylate cyclase [uncultured Cohaesibacter sp.]